MTSGEPQYHSARRIYEHYGLRRLLDVKDFFREGGESEGESYIVCGRRMTDERLQEYDRRERIQEAHLE